MPNQGVARVPRTEHIQLLLEDNAMSDRYTADEMVAAAEACDAWPSWIHKPMVVRYAGDMLRQAAETERGKTCEWVRKSGDDGYYSTQCLRLDGRMARNFCPHCGGKVVTQ